MAITHSKRNKKNDNYDSETIIYIVKTKIAGKKIVIESYNKEIIHFFKDYLSKYDEEDFVICTTSEDVINQKNPNYEDMLYYNGRLVENDISSELITICRKVANAMVEYNTVLIHGAAIAIDGKCYIFTAPSGTGKTTHVLKWLKLFPQSIVINGDKPFVNLDTKQVYGSPWSGKEDLNKNITAHLAGIIALDRGENNSIMPISFKQMLPVLIQQTYIPEGGRELKKKAFQLIGLFKDVPCYQLRCTIDDEAAVVAYNGIKENEKLLHNTEIDN